MDTIDLNPLVEDLASNISDLEESLQPLLTTALSASTSNLPLLDKAKLYVLTTYAIESLLFSYLRLNGIDAKAHPVFQELTRVKHYFDKLKTAELGPAKPTQRLDKSAAGRFIKAGLSGNDEYDAQRRDRTSTSSKRKFEDMTERVGTHTRFEYTAKKIKADDQEVLDEDDGAAVQPDENVDDESARKDITTTIGGTDDHAVKKSKKKKKSLPQDSDANLPKRTKSSKPPKSQSEAFQALLQKSTSNVDDGSNEKEKEKKKKRKGHTKDAKQTEN